MNRLTRRYKSHVSVVCENCSKFLSCNGIETCQEILKNRLAKYEDIGLTPSEIMKILNNKEN